MKKTLFLMMIVGLSASLLVGGCKPKKSDDATDTGTGTTKKDDAAKCTDCVKPADKVTKEAIKTVEDMTKKAAEAAKPSCATCTKPTCEGCPNATTKKATDAVKTAAEETKAKAADALKKATEDVKAPEAPATDTKAPVTDAVKDAVSTEAKKVAPKVPAAE